MIDVEAFLRGEIICQKPQEQASGMDAMTL